MQPTKRRKNRETPQQLGRPRVVADRATIPPRCRTEDVPEPRSAGGEDFGWGRAQRGNLALPKNPSPSGLQLLDFMGERVRSLDCSQTLVFGQA
jgi:hypothetical protein